jgi:hypothetical protein
VGDFLPEGGSGGSHNYIGVADPNAGMCGKAADGTVLELKN